MKEIPAELKLAISRFESMFRSAGADDTADYSLADKYIPIRPPPPPIWGRNGLAVFVRGKRSGWAVARVPPDTVQEWKVRLTEAGIQPEDDPEWNTSDGERISGHAYKLGFWLNGVDTEQHEPLLANLVHDIIGRDEARAGAVLRIGAVDQAVTTDRLTAWDFVPPGRSDTPCVALSGSSRRHTAR